MDERPNHINNDELGEIREVVSAIRLGVNDFSQNTYNRSIVERCVEIQEDIIKIQRGIDVGIQDKITEDEITESEERLSENFANILGGIYQWSQDCWEPERERFKEYANKVIDWVNDIYSPLPANDDLRAGIIRLPGLLEIEYGSWEPDKESIDPNTRENADNAINDSMDDESSVDSAEKDKPSIYDMMKSDDDEDSIDASEIEEDDRIFKVDERERKALEESDMEYRAIGSVDDFEGLNILTDKDIKTLTGTGSEEYNKMAKAFKEGTRGRGDDHVLYAAIEYLKKKDAVPWSTEGKRRVDAAAKLMAQDFINVYVGNNEIDEDYFNDVRAEACRNETFRQIMLDKLPEIVAIPDFNDKERVTSLYGQILICDAKCKMEGKTALISGKTWSYDISKDGRHEECLKAMNSFKAEFEKIKDKNPGLSETKLMGKVYQNVNAMMRKAHLDNKMPEIKPSMLEEHVETGKPYEPKNDTVMM